MSVLAVLPVLEPSPNLLAQARMRLDEELDLIPPHGLVTRLRSNFFAGWDMCRVRRRWRRCWWALGFLAGNFTYRYEVAHAPKPKTPVILTQCRLRVRLRM